MNEEMVTSNVLYDLQSNYFDLFLQADKYLTELAHKQHEMINSNDTTSSGFQFIRSSNGFVESGISFQNGIEMSHCDRSVECVDSSLPKFSTHSFGTAFLSSSNNNIKYYNSKEDPKISEQECYSELGELNNASSLINEEAEEYGVIISNDFDTLDKEFVSDEPEFVITTFERRKRDIDTLRRHIPKNRRVKKNTKKKKSRNSDGIYTHEAINKVKTTFSCNRLKWKGTSRKIKGLSIPSNKGFSSNQREQAYLELSAKRNSLFKDFDTLLKEKSDKRMKMKGNAMVKLDEQVDKLMKRRNAIIDAFMRY